MHEQCFVLAHMNDDSCELATPLFYQCYVDQMLFTLALLQRAFDRI